jgi:hypothetical protein
MIVSYALLENASFPQQPNPAEQAPNGNVNERNRDEPAQLAAACLRRISTGMCNSPRVCPDRD